METAFNSVDRDVLISAQHGINFAKHITKQLEC